MTRKLRLLLCGGVCLMSMGLDQARAGGKDANKLVADDQQAYVQEAWTTLDAFDRTVFNARVEFKRAGTYRIVYGYHKDGKWMYGGLVGTKYFGEEVVRSGGGTIKTYAFKLTARPPLNRKWDVEIYPDE